MTTNEERILSAKMNDPLQEYFAQEEALARRYATLLRNLRAASPSFFDAYLELLEAFFKGLAGNYHRLARCFKIKEQA